MEFESSSFILGGSRARGLAAGLSATQRSRRGNGRMAGRALPVDMLTFSDRPRFGAVSECRNLNRLATTMTAPSMRLVCPPSPVLRSAGCSSRGASIDVGIHTTSVEKRQAPVESARATPLRAGVEGSLGACKCAESRIAGIRREQTVGVIDAKGY